MKKENNNSLVKGTPDLLANVPLTKEGLTQLATVIVKGVLDGDKNALEVDIQLRYLAELVDMIRKHALMKREVQDEADKYPEKTFDAYGATVTKTQRSDFDYSQCDDSVWNQIIKDILILNDQRKRRETFLKSLGGDSCAVNEETGELINPPLKQSSDSLRISLK